MDQNKHELVMTFLLNRIVDGILEAMQFTTQLSSMISCAPNRLDEPSRAALSATVREVIIDSHSRYLCSLLDWMGVIL
jgi:hypothetical protein